MNALLKIIDEKNNQLLEFDAKKEERDNLVAKLAVLDKEISEFNKEQLCNDIDELTDYAIKLGFIEVQTSEEEVSENSQYETSEEV